ncbi:uncharacterized protein LOC118701200 [Molothrus ater]|uniref:uncharacterized protein LOC118701200 n=1 Tax=Molothrus ater TaxID=84834 RepID=UPI0023E7FCFD|nr:uncharacterized protein LOC118701200 [Molothrus ater]
MEQRPPRVPKLAGVAEEEEEEEGPGAAPAQETEEVVPFHPPQEDAALERTQEQESSRGRFRRTAQVPAATPTWAGPAVPAQPSTVCAALHATSPEETSIMGTGLRAHSELLSHETSAALLDLLLEKGVARPEQVPAMVRSIHRWLLANDSAQHRLDKALLNLTRAHPGDAVVTLLRAAPSCDRAAISMWKTIMCSSRTAEPVLLILLDVLGSWPERSTCTSDGDKTGVFGLAATVVMWKMLQEPHVPRVVTSYFPQLFVHLLFQVFFSTEEMPEEVDAFWKECLQEHGLATSPNRFAVQSLKSLLCQKQYKEVVVSVERKRGWDTLLCADTRHYAVGLLAREMRHACLGLGSSIALHLLWLLSTQEPHWDLPALAFLVELLQCLDASECGASVVKVSSRYLQSECRERRRLALRALLELIDDPSMAERMWSLTQCLMDLLCDNDAEIAGMTLITLSFLFLHKSHILMSTPIALQLAEALLPLFDHTMVSKSVPALLVLLLFHFPRPVVISLDEDAELGKEGLEQATPEPPEPAWGPLLWAAAQKGGHEAESSGLET